MPYKKKNFALTLVVCLGVALVAKAEFKVGGTFPKLGDQNLEGKLPDTSKAKVVMVDFWASWCAPCAKSFPVMEELQKKYGPEGFVIVAISVDESKADMDSFMKSHKVSFTVVRDAKLKLVEKAGVKVMPSSFILRPDGKVIFTHTGFYGAETKKQYVQEIEGLLKDPVK